MPDPRNAAQTAVEVSLFGLDSAGKPFTQKAAASELTPAGARLTGVRAMLNVGEIVGVSCGTQKARFRVTWAGARGTPQEGQIRIESAEPGKRIWPATAMAAEGGLAPKPAEGSAVPQPRPTARPVTPIRGPKRRHVRFTCDGGAKVRVAGQVATWANLKDLSIGGCYLETAATHPLGTQVSLQIGTEGVQLLAAGIVKTCHPGFGMGVEFTFLDPDSRTTLERWSARQAQAS